MQGVAHAIVGCTNVETRKSVDTVIFVIEGHAALSEAAQFNIFNCQFIMINVQRHKANKPTQNNLRFVKVLETF